MIRLSRQTSALRLAVLVLTLAAPAIAHEPHKAVPPSGEEGVVATPIPLPAGWSALPPPAAAGAMAPGMVADGEGFLVSWIEPVTGRAPGAQRVRLARFDGQYWTFPATVRESTTLFANWADVPGVVRATDGTLYAWWLESSGAGTYTYEVRLARSVDQGKSFAPIGVLHDDTSASEHGFVSAVPEGAGVRFYYLDGRATVREAPMQLRTAFVEGERIGPSELIDDSVCDCCATAAVALAGGAGGPGGSAVAYRDRSAGEIRDIQVVLRPATGGLRSSAVAKDGWKIAGCPVNGPALSAQGGQLAVAWFTAPGDRPRLSLARSEDSGATWSAPQTLGSSKAMGQLAMAPLGGGFAVSWLEAIEGGSELRLAEVDAASKLAPPLAVARTGAGRFAGIPRLAVAANRPALLWLAPAAGPDGKSLQFAVRTP